ncbi:MAG: hypothetical protein H6945_11105 [Zoogloeaceae bacterium]|nr:hypothetical protein [Rhodocyclaceae bacterium]MCP5236273.1 hypothetical protein [Zoogloeaceae bacterium]
MNHYEPDQLSNISVEALDETRSKIRYRVMSETLYYCPGADAERTDGELRLSFVRCPINKKCSVTHAAERDASGENTIVVDNGGGPIVIVSEHGRRQIHP